MNCEKQIQEIKKILNYTCNEYDENNRQIRNKCNSYDCEYWSEENHCCCSYGQKEAEAIYNAGYRKASEVAREIIDTAKSGAEKYINDVTLHEGIRNMLSVMLDDFVAELKKKYTEEKECITEKEIR